MAMHNNPFYHRGPIHEIEHFYNRHSSADCVLGLLQNLQNIAVVGPRKIGKTSFLHYISHPSVLQNYDIDPKKTLSVYIDCQGLSPLGREEIYKSMLTSISDALEVVGVGLVPGLQVEQMTYALFERTFKEISRKGFKVILLLDEFEAMSRNPKLGEEFFSGLRALPNKYEMAYVTASCISLDELYHEHHSLLSSNFFNTFYPIQLGLFSRKDSRHLIEASLHRVGKCFSPQLLELVLETGGNHPFFLQIAGYRAFGSPPLNEKPTQVERRAFFKGVSSEAAAHFRYYWQKLGDQERYILAALPLLNKDPGYRKSIENLKKQCLIAQRDANYEYFSPLLEAFVRRQKVNGLVQATPLLIDQHRKQVLLRGMPLNLSPANYTLLVYLAERVGRVVTNEELGKAMWPDEYYVGDERLKSSIKSLRKTLGNDASCIVNRRGEGYIYQAPPE